MSKLKAIALVVGLSAANLPGAFIVPEIPFGAQTEFAWWDNFTDPFTDFVLPEPGGQVDPFSAGEGNVVDRAEADNTDALLFQTGTSSAFITSTNGIYSTSATPQRYLIYDAPAFEADSVLLQTFTIGNLPDLESARLFYRESVSGPLLAAGGPQGNGFLLEGSGAFAMWEWDLTGETIADYFIVFDASESAMSLQEVQLDTFDQATSFLGVALSVETNSDFTTVGRVEHRRVGEAEPQATYEEGDLVEVEAVPSSGSGHIFVGWGGDLTGNSSPATLVITGQPQVRAVFAPENYEGWKFNQINPFVTSPPFSVRAAMMADPDGDGLVNLFEYALGGAPEDASDLATVRPQARTGESGQPEFSFRRQIAATDLSYRVKVSTDLVNWNHNGDGSGQVYTEELPDPAFNGDGTETVVVRPVQPLPDGASVFFRLEVTHLP